MFFQDLLVQSVEMYKLFKISGSAVRINTPIKCAHTFKRRMSQGYFSQGVANLDQLFPPNTTQEERKLDAQVREKLQEFTKLSFEGGGPRSIERHVKKNKKMLVRERIKRIIDPGTEFLEIGTLAGFDMMYGDIPAGGLVAGIGRVCGVYCMIGGNDATVKGGTYFPITLKKSLRTQEIAQRNRLPCIYIPDSGGAYLPLQSEIFLQGGRSFYNQAVMSSSGIYQIAVVCGSCTAGGAYNPTMSDEAIIVENVGKIYLGGPPLVRAATGEIVSDEDLGGAFLHSTVSGCTDYFAKNEEEAFVMCRDVVESLNIRPNSSIITGYDEPSHSIFSDFIGKLHFEKSELYSIIAGLIDGSKFKEFKTYFGPGLIAGVAYIQGMVVGIVANCDQILSEEALKASHFMQMCNTRRIPLIFLQNSMPATLENRIETNQVVLKDRGKMCAMVSTVTVPKIALAISACHEDDNALMCGPSFSPNISLTWPSAKFSSLLMDESESQPQTFDAFDSVFNMHNDILVLPESTRNVIAEILKIVDQQSVHIARSDPSPVLRM
ncbi:unnamed protein product [Allacma fusca]|uniref:methylcrotonoyl-CoA carboxylase n=1 Tax=Allacma fusca TaxID=39272 RepID=A0A8J2PEH3_9HEXA|nr:unnamed protein product [Allacma fusca]